jgi:hypothetical protein
LSWRYNERTVEEIKEDFWGEEGQSEPEGSDWDYVDEATRRAHGVEDVDETFEAHSTMAAEQGEADGETPCEKKEAWAPKPIWVKPPWGNAAPWHRPP